jgi:hypothetical protein
VPHNRMSATTVVLVHGNPQTEAICGPLVDPLRLTMRWMENGETQEEIQIVAQ